MFVTKSSDASVLNLGENNILNCLYLGLARMTSQGLLYFLEHSEPLQVLHV
jgi:hypothetical protein